jgi:hypothetical protein
MAMIWMTEESAFDSPARYISLRHSGHIGSVAHPPYMTDTEAFSGAKAAGE